MAAETKLITHWYTTPRELRAIADHLESRWGNVTAGQEVPRYDTYRDLVVVVDQDAMHKEAEQRRRIVERTEVT